MLIYIYGVGYQTVSDKLFMNVIVSKGLISGAGLVATGVNTVNGMNQQNSINTLDSKVKTLEAKEATDSKLK